MRKILFILLFMYSLALTQNTETVFFDKSGNFIISVNFFGENYRGEISKDVYTLSLNSYGAYNTGKEPELKIIANSKSSDLIGLYFHNVKGSSLGKPIKYFLCMSNNPVDKIEYNTYPQIMNDGSYFFTITIKEFNMLKNNYHLLVEFDNHIEGYYAPSIINKVAKQHEKDIKNYKVYDMFIK